MTSVSLLGSCHSESLLNCSSIFSDDDLQLAEASPWSSAGFNL